MDTRSGDIYDEEAQERLRKLFPDQEEHLKRVEATNLSNIQRTQLAAVGHTKVGRNDPCPCGSGKKFKRCCLDKNK